MPGRRGRDRMVPALTPTTPATAPSYAHPMADRDALERLLDEALAALPVYAVPRNDLAAAVAFYRERGQSITNDEMHSLIMLQDDPTELLAIAMHWTIVPAAPLAPMPPARRSR